MGMNYLFKCGKCKKEEYRKLPDVGESGTVACNTCNYRSDMLIIIPAHIPKEQWKEYIKLRTKKGRKNGKIRTSST